jgi:hypothetical protein
MLRFLVATFVVSVAASGAAMAQQSPYVGRDTLTIKALTPEEVRAHLTGEGMGLALPAELNGYPGPRHVLELADSLGLGPTRRALLQGVYDGMHAEAVRLGHAIVAAEASLDSAFAAHRMAAQDLEARLAHIATLQGRLRYVHLFAHLQVTALLSTEEVRAYQRLRGYATGHEHGEHQKH